MVKLMAYTDLTFLSEMHFVSVFLPLHPLPDYCYCHNYCDDHCGTRAIVPGICRKLDRKGKLFTNGLTCARSPHSFRTSEGRSFISVVNLKFFINIQCMVIDIFFRHFQVPELAGFWLLTILVQTPLVLFMLFNEAVLILPLQRATTIILTAFVIFEVLAGYFAIKFMVDYQVTKFHLQQFTSLDGVDEMGQPGFTYRPKMA